MKEEVDGIYSEKEGKMNRKEGLHGLLGALHTRRLRSTVSAPGIELPYRRNVVSPDIMDLLQVSLVEKAGEGQKARETCNTWHAH